MRLKHIAPLGVDRLGDRANALRDRTILRLENLDTDLRPPGAALRAAHAAIDDDHANSYLPFLGTDALRAAAAAHVSRMAGHEYDWRASCVITAGGLNGILNTLFALIEPGTDVILTNPCYVGLLNRVRLAGGVPKLVPFRYARDRWNLDLDELRRAATSKVHLVLMMSPSMPSGAVLNRKEWGAIAQACAGLDVPLLYDAAMERIVYDGLPIIHPAGLPGLKSRTITVGSASKEYRMIGWRTGWVVGPAKFVAKIGEVAMANAVTPVGIAQSAVACALSGNQANVSSAVREWQQRRDVLYKELRGLDIRRADGGWSFLLDVSPLGMDAETASQRLLEIGKIAATPMTGWGGRDASRYVRLVFSNEPPERLVGAGKRFRKVLLN